MNLVVMENAWLMRYRILLFELLDFYPGTPADIAIVGFLNIACYEPSLCPTEDKIWQRVRWQALLLGYSHYL